MSSPAALASQCAEARMCRSMRLTFARGAVAKHTAGQIKAHNANNAVRADDIINVQDRRRRKIAGRGRSRKWLPSACLRCRRKNSQQS